ncbi:MAG: hypothetical protein LC722_08915 [Actinobacteria bacterium]|nr:hypothetical protein [Actinomycetota bacterium]
MSLRDNEIGRRVLPHLESGWEVLDLGSGTGRLMRWQTYRPMWPTLRTYRHTLFVLDRPD